MKREYFSGYWFRRARKALGIKPQIFYKRIKNWLGYKLCIFLKGYAPLPAGIFITITKKCNLSCKMCDYSPGSIENFMSKMLSHEKELSVQDWKNFIDDVSVFRPAIFFVAAEPLLYSGTEELIRYIKKEKKLLCSLATNGFLLKEFAGSLVDAGLDYLEVSFDGPEHIHDSIRGREGSFKRLVEGIREIQHIRGKHGKPRINVTYAISDYNFAELVRTMDILDSLNEHWDSISFCHLSYLSKPVADRHNREYPDVKKDSRSISKVNPLGVDVEVLKKQIELVKKMKHKAVRFMPDLSDDNLLYWYSDPLRIKNDNRKCSFPWINANITPGGAVMPLLSCSNVIFGNIKQDVFKTVWNNQGFRNFRLRVHKAGKFPACFSCCSLK